MAFLIFCFLCGYLIADPSCSSASSHVGMEAAAFYGPPSPSDFHLPCLEIEGIWIKGGGAGERPFAKWAFPWLWECAQVPGYANFQTSVFRREEKEEMATMDSLLMQEDSWKGDQVLHYFLIFLAHGTAQTSLWCLKYSKALLREEEFPCSSAPCFFSRYPQRCCSIKWSLVSPERWVKHTEIPAFTPLPCWILLNFISQIAGVPCKRWCTKKTQYRSSFGRE